MKKITLAKDRNPSIKLTMLERIVRIETLLDHLVENELKHIWQILWWILSVAVFGTLITIAIQLWMRK